MSTAREDWLLRRGWLDQWDAHDEQPQRPFEAVADAYIKGAVYTMLAIGAGVAVLGAVIGNVPVIVLGAAVIGVLQLRFTWVDPSSVATTYAMPWDAYDSALARCRTAYLAGSIDTDEFIEQVALVDAVKVPAGENSYYANASYVIVPDDAPAIGGLSPSSPPYIVQKRTPSNLRCVCCADVQAAEAARFGTGETHYWLPDGWTEHEGYYFCDQCRHHGVHHGVRGRWICDQKSHNEALTVDQVQAYH